MFSTSAAVGQRKSDRQQRQQQQRQQKQQKQSFAPEGKPIMWERVNISRRDLFYGPGGRDMMPDLSRITFIKEEKGGHNKKYRIKDGAGKIWVAKLGREAQPETAAVRLMWALGYKTEINYLVPSLTIPGKGTFRNVRLEARPDNIERLDEWKWKRNPFIGTKEFQGLKIMQVFLTNWDIVDVQNKILQVDGRNGKELHYIISDLGATFGKLGNNNLPIIYRLGRKTGKPSAYIKTSLVREVKENGRVRLAYKGKNRWLFKDIMVEDVDWLSRLLLQLSDKQIRDAFRAANYSPGDVNTLTQAVKNKITELSRVTTEDRFSLLTDNE
ncbi:MAG: hypothetical protein M3384_14205 [Acidobacteriota bacterium]|nr:hypothetical protein [Acidobacteriota bacterium]